MGCLRVEDNGVFNAHLRTIPRAHGGGPRLETSRVIQTPSMVLQAFWGGNDFAEHHEIRGPVVAWRAPPRRSMPAAPIFIRVPSLRPQFVELFV